MPQDTIDSIMQYHSINFGGEEEYPFAQADYEAIKQIAMRNGGTITNEQIFSITMGGYLKLARIKEQLIKDGIIQPEKKDKNKDEDPDTETRN